MLIFRALNNKDIQYYNNNEDIYCSLVNRYENTRDNIIKKYYNLCIEDKFKYALDSMVGHVSGIKLDCGISPWISVSPSFDMVASEYSIPQAGRYNLSRERKPMIIVDINEDSILHKKEEIKELRDKKIDSCVIDITKGRLNQYFEYGSILAEKYNEDMPGYDVVASLNKELGAKTNIKGFSNYADAVDETLIYNKIKKEDIKAYLSPELIDIIYSCNININKYIKLISEKYNLFNRWLSILDIDYLGTNLIKYLIENYNNIDGNTIEEKYETLKNIKLEMIKGIIEHVNKKYKLELNPTRVLDDKVFVSSYDNISNFNRKNKNDLLLIEKDGKLYEYLFEKKGYYDEIDNELIPIGKVLEKIK